MSLSDEKIQEFQKLYREHFGKDISKEDAKENGIKLLRLISVLYGPKKDKGSIIKINIKNYGRNSHK